MIFQVDFLICLFNLKVARPNDQPRKTADTGGLIVSHLVLTFKGEMREMEEILSMHHCDLYFGNTVGYILSSGEEVRVLKGSARGKLDRQDGEERVGVGLRTAVSRRVTKATKSEVQNGELV